MNKLKVTTHAFFAITCAFIIHSKSFAEPANHGLLMAEIKAYHDSGEYEKELCLAITRADRYIQHRAEANAQQAKPQKLAIVLDIDETSLSYYNYIVAHDFTYNKKVWEHELQTTDAPAIKPMLSLYHDAQQHDVAVFFVTGRTQSMQKATERNLKSAGYQNWAELYLKPNNYKQPSAIPYKAQARADITKKGYTIIASLGDQKSDLIGGYAEKTFKLPNPYYYIP